MSNSQINEQEFYIKKKYKYLLVFCDDNKIREAQVLKKKPLSSLQCLHFNQQLTP